MKTSTLRINLVCRFFIGMVLICFINPKTVSCQHISGTYSITTPEASLFFLKPGYMNSAFGYGVLAMHSNPASLRQVDGKQTAFAVSFPYRSESAFSIRATDSTEVYDPFYLDTEMNIHERGGLTSIGYAHQFNQWRVGVAINQPRRVGFNLKAGGSLLTPIHFQLDKEITQNLVDDLPSESIPFNWDVSTDVNLALDGSATELYLSVLPITAGVAYQYGVLSLGAALTYYNISSSHQPATLTSYISGKGSITGTPYGNDPVTGEPWQGEIVADFDVEDQPITASYDVNFSGSRMGMTVGASLQWGVLGGGVALSRGFKGNVDGQYQFSTIYTSGLPAKYEFEKVQLNPEAYPRLDGHATLRLAQFEKDTLSYDTSHQFTVGGFNSYSIGVHFLILGAFVRGQLPDTYPDLGSMTFGIYADIPLPWLPIEVNTGYIQKVEGIQTRVDKLIPLRVTSHVGAGVGVKFPFNRWMGMGEQPSWLRVGLRSSLVSMAFDLFEQEADKTHSKSLPSIWDTVALSVGLETPLEF